MHHCNCGGSHGLQLDRRRFLRIAGLAGASLGLGEGYTFGTDKVIPPRAERPRLYNARLSCGNAPFGGPFYPSEKTTSAISTKALFDLDRVWAIGQEIVVLLLNGQGDPWVQSVQQKVHALAPQWCDYANLAFRFVTDGPCHMSVNFYPFYDGGQLFDYGTYNCFIGTDTQKYLTATQSMNLVFSPQMPHQYPRAFVESEVDRVILHEFGHAIGLIHEHQWPDRPIVWNVDPLNAYAKRYWGWDPKTVKEQIIDPDPAVNLAGTVFDIHSIMMYEYPYGLAHYQDGSPFATPYNSELTALDKVAASTTYPKTADILGEQALMVGNSPQPGKIAQAGQVARYRFQSKAGTQVNIQTEGMPTLVALLRSPSDPQQRGSLSNIVGAAEFAAGQTTSQLNVTLPTKTDDIDNYYIEVRHQKPILGKGDFTIFIK